MFFSVIFTAIEFKMKNVVIFSIFLVLVLYSPGLFCAPPPPPAGAPPCWPPPCMPIDGGITFLIAAGAAYGAKKLYNKRKNKPAEAL